MANNTNVPDIAVVLQDKKTVLGYVPATTEFTEDIRFNACSEISFTTPQKIYNIEKERWEDNPVYSELEKHRLIYLNDNTNYFRYPVKEIGDSSFYTVSGLPTRGDTTLSYNPNDGLHNFQVQSETELYDVGTGGKYVFDRFSYIPYDEFGEGYRLNGSVVNFSHLHWGSGAAAYNPYQACSVFFPVEGTDIIAVRTGVMTGETVNGSTVASGKFKFKWHIVAYRDQDAETMVGEWTMPITSGWQSDKVWRIRVSDIGYNSTTQARPMSNGGYIRFWFENSTGSTGSSDYTYTSSSSGWSGNCRWWYPVSGFCKIYSGERRVTRVNNVTREFDPTLPDYVYHKMRWFEIVSTSEEDDGIMRKKTVTARSYEYTLSHTTFSVSESTLPLYIPDVISNCITNDSQWPVDKKSGYSTQYAGQRTPRGIINQILDYLPGWSVKYASSELMARYRVIEDADDVDVYNYLMNTIQPVYNCFVVFDTDDNTISFYTKTELAGISSYRALTWDNSIKHFEKENMDTSYFTAIRVHAGDDTYPFGVVNPTGGGMIYNFDRIMPKLNYTLDGVPSEYSRTMAEAVTQWMDYYNNQILRGSTYYNACIRFMRQNAVLLQADVDRREALSNYRAKASQINAYLKDDWENGERFDSPPHFHTVLISERPRTVDEIRNDGSSSHTKYYHNATLQNELASCADAYWKAVNRYDSAAVNHSSNKVIMGRVAASLTMNPTVALQRNNGNKYAFSPVTKIYDYDLSPTTILSAAEITELSKYIVEGTWTYENATFSDTYNVSDIYETLREVLYDAKEDLADRLSIANFDFTVDVANILAIPEFEWERREALDPATKGLYLGGLVTLEISKDERLTPMLLELHRNYKDSNDFKLTFTTDMKRRPIVSRFTDLFGTISQTSVVDKSFTFDT